MPTSWDVTCAVRMFYNHVKFLYLEFCHITLTRVPAKLRWQNFPLDFSGVETLFIGCFSILSILLHFSYILLISKIYWTTTQQYFPYLCSKDVEIYEFIKVIIIKYLYRICVSFYSNLKLTTQPKGSL